jgi:hypothetical protein
MIIAFLLVQAASAPPPVVTVTAPRVTLGAGARRTVEVVATIRKGFRIQANPASQPFLVPARLEIDADDRIEIGSPEYPRGTPYRLQGTTEDLSVYADRLVIRVPLTARRTTGKQSSAELVLAGRLRYQACNEQVCLRPATAPVELPVSLRPR